MHPRDIPPVQEAYERPGKSAATAERGGFINSIPGREDPPSARTLLAILN